MGRGGDIETAVLRRIVEEHGVDLKAVAEELGWYETATRRKRLVNGELGNPFMVRWVNKRRIEASLGYKYNGRKGTFNLYTNLVVARAVYNIAGLPWNLGVSTAPTSRSRRVKSLKVLEETLESRDRRERKRREVQSAPEDKAHRLRVGLEWRKRNRAHMRLRYAQRRALTRLDEDGRLYAEIIRSDPCADCSEPAEEMDHIVAVSRGGEKEWTNLTGSCTRCNRRKWVTPLLMFLWKGVV